MERSGLRRPPLILRRLWANCARVRDWTSICRPRLSGNMLAGLEQQRHTATEIRRMVTTCGILLTPISRRIPSDRRTRIHGGFTTCMGMYMNGVLTGTVLWRMARIPKVLPRGRPELIVAAAGSTMRSAVPRPTGAAISRRKISITMASA